MKRMLAVFITALITLGILGYLYNQKGQGTNIIANENLVETSANLQEPKPVAMSASGKAAVGSRGPMAAPASVSVDKKKVYSIDELKDKLDKEVNKLNDNVTSSGNYQLNSSISIKLEDNSIGKLACQANSLKIRELLIGPLEGQMYFWIVFEDGESVGFTKPLRDEGNARWTVGDNEMHVTLMWSKDSESYNINFIGIITKL